MPSKFGFQPTPLTPPDFSEYLQYQNSLNSLIRETLHTPSSKVKLGEPNKKSIPNNKDGERRNRNRSK